MYNYGYIPLPIAEVFFPVAVATLMIHNVGVEIALWTAGVLIASGQLGGGWWRRVLNPPVVAIAGAVLINAVGLSPQVPRLALDATDMLGRCGIPLGLVLSGAVIFDMLKSTDWRSGWPALAGAMVIRTLVLPAIFLLLARSLPLSVELKQVMVIQAAMPAASFTVVVAKMYQQDADTAVRIVAGTTLLGIATIPIWLMIGRSVVGV
jgi:malate permease and related proteins